MKPEAPFHAFAYDATMMILDAIEKVGVVGSDGSLTIDRMKLRDALYATKNHKGLPKNQNPPLPTLYSPEDITNEVTVEYENYYWQI